MKKLKSSLPNMLLSLTGFCIVVSAALGMMNEITKEPIAKAEVDAKVTAIKQVVNAFEVLATILANIIAILFAFITNDAFVFKQERKNWAIRLAKFFLARLSTLGLDVLLTYIFVTSYPNIIGQFVEQNIDRVNTIETILAQILIIILNYILSKIYIFKKDNSSQKH